MLENDDLKYIEIGYLIFAVVDFIFWLFLNNQLSSFGLFQPFEIMGFIGGWLTCFYSLGNLIVNLGGYFITKCLFDDMEYYYEWKEPNMYYFPIVINIIVLIVNAIITAKIFIAAYIVLSIFAFPYLVYKFREKFANKY